ncbi:YfgM family protein [Paraferrimonas sedimenticola]|uniref:Ancillary SecYEG translocon subunit n=1 Tax=Paraferrimonas sedimenticola TaxID=375674 RepID=A0AA37RTQ0_9GAMM|nr:tetratricopeptide repeat protein [Paraferrimonas sedimenticola]GLP95091.1 hypothetical protein GCM10007895_03970 [Paraferrimonas sedimenticola]
MEIHSTEEQQVEAIKTFWKEYGSSIVLGAALGLGGLFGWNYYTDSQQASAEAASAAYQQIVTNSASDAAIVSAAETFAAEHKEPGYDALLQLLAAKAAVADGDLDKAKTALKQVMDSKVGGGLPEVASIRYARIQAQQGELDGALATLDGVKAESFDAKVAEVRGDILVRQGNTEEAAKAYQAAIDAGTMSAASLQMKLDNLNVAG